MTDCGNCRLTMIEQIKTKSTDKCDPIFPFPKEHKLQSQTQMKASQIPTTFRFKQNYNDKLNSAKCSSVFSQYNMKAINEAIDSGKVMKPKFLIAPMKTNISFFDKKINTYSITNTELSHLKTISGKLPTYYSWMENDLITKPFNQGLCGSCWAVASATCLSDVFVVSKKVDSNPKLSPTYILSCLPQSQCDGGDPSKAVHDMTNEGISTSECLDYSWCTNSACSGDPLKHFGAKNVNEYIPPCQCSTKSGNQQKYFAADSVSICIPPKLKEFNVMERNQLEYYFDNMYGNVEKDTVDLSSLSTNEIQDLIRYHIFTYGPVMGGFHVFKNFFKGEFSNTNDIYIETVTYKGVPGIDYSDVEKDWVGSHAVVIVGWGEDTVHGELVKYWLVRNSWGKNWGNQGIWKMAMYGNDPSKKYQNRVSQFEYPSIVNTDNGIGITGGIIMMKAGDIKGQSLVSSDNPDTALPTSNVMENKERHSSSSASVLTFIIFLLFILSLFYIFRQDKPVWIISSQTILAVLILSLLVGLLPQSNKNA
jgi:C1A family cysteine protease